MDQENVLQVRIKLKNRRVYIEECEGKFPDSYLVTFERLIFPDEREKVKNMQTDSNHYLTHNGKVLVNKIILSKTVIDAMHEGVKYLMYEKLKQDA